MRDLVNDISYDAGSALMKGKRDTQQDALASDFREGSDFGFVVLSDGMGGHNAGEIASAIVVSEVFESIQRQSKTREISEGTVPRILCEAADIANERLREHSAENPETTGMGATLVALILTKGMLFWVSIGDSPLFLFRDGKLSQLNEDHSLAPQIDYLVSAGVITESEGRKHPDRNCLTSVLVGGAIPQIDCSVKPFLLRHGDLVIVASDGLQYLSERQIERVLRANVGATSSVIADLLKAEIEILDHPHQDNICYSIIKVGSH